MKRLFTKASLTSLLFGKAETVSIVKDLGIDEIKPSQKNDFNEKTTPNEFLPDEEKNKKSEIAQNDEKNENKPSTSSKVKATLQKIYEKHPHLAPKKVDGLEIEGLRRVKVVEKKDEKDEFEKSEDWVLQRLFKKAGAVVDSGRVSK